MKILPFSSVVLLCLLTAAGCNRTPEGRRDAFMVKARELVAKKEFARALLEFRNASQAMPRDPEPLFEMSVAAEQAGDLRTAVQALQKALEADPKHTKSRLRMAQFLAASKDPELLKEAQEKLQALLAEGVDETSTLASLALAQVQLGDFDGAIGSLERILSKTPSELAASVLLARAKLAQGGPKAAEQVLRDACEKMPKSAAARVVLAEFYVAQRRPAEAQEILQQALSLDPQHGRALLDMARLHVAGGRKAEAGEIFKRLSLQTAGAETIYGQFLLREGRKDEALAEFERLAKAKPDDRRIRTALVAVYNNLGRKADSYRLLAAALQKNAKDGEALMQRAELRIQDRQFNEAEADINAVHKLRPNDAGVRYVLARLNLARGSVLTYRQELSEALRLNPMLEAVRAELASSLIQGGQAKTALEVLNGAPPDQGSSKLLALQRVAVHSALGNAREMRAELDAALARSPGDPDWLTWEAMWKLRSGNVAAGRASLETIVKARPDDVSAARLLTNSYLQQKDIPGAVAKARELVARHPGSAPMQLLLGNLLSANKDRPAARKALEAALAIDPSLVEATMALAQLDVIEKQVDGASKRVGSVLALDPNNQDALLWSANLAIMREDKPAASALLRKLLDINPKNPDALNNLAYVLSETEKVDDGLKFAEQAVELAPDNGDFADTLGWILYKKGVYRGAIQHLEKAVAKSKDPGARYHLAMAYAKAGEKEKGKDILRAALRESPDHPLASQAQAGMAQ
ncbi:MAG: tetratricopeptide repeat protein [Bryobacterales bacterium]|nr:tetratricopeptide repeat protein [Bryobacterales bacterium]